MNVYEGGGQIAITFAYDRELVDSIKAITGARWNRDKKIWTIPWIPESVKHLLDVAEVSGLQIDHGLREKIYDFLTSESEKHG